MSPAAVIRVVDDDDAFRSAMTRLLESVGFSVRGYGSAGAYLLDDAERDSPGCLLLDLYMPGPTGLELHEALARRGDALPIVYLTGQGDVPTSVRAMKAGAVDFLTKPVDRGALMAAVAAALVKDAERRAARSRREDLEARYAALSARECDVLAHVVAGRLNKQIADELGIAERTVKAHRAQVMAKMRAESLAELVALVGEMRSAHVASS